MVLVIADTHILQVMDLRMIIVKDTHRSRLRALRVRGKLNAGGGFNDSAY